MTEPKYRPKQITFVAPKKINHYIPTLEDRKQREEQLKEYLQKNSVTKVPSKMCYGSKWIHDD